MTAFAFPFGVMAVLALVWFVFRSGGYKREPLAAPPGPDWIRTEERFADPTTGETVEVWFHPTSGERAYVRARPGAS